MAGKSHRDRLIDAALDLAAERAWRDVTLADVAAAANLPLATAAEHFASTHDILAAFMAATDRAVLEAVAGEQGEDRALDRLFDVVMKRLELLEPRKAALRSILASVGSAPFEQLCLAGPVLRSQQLMLEAAAIRTGGGRGMVLAKGLALVYARTLRTFVNDDDPGLARTMARLDRELRRGERVMRRLDGPIGFARSLCRFVESARAARRARTASAPQHD